MKKFLRHAIITCLGKPFTYGLIGLDVHRKDKLPRKGPAIIAANHNSYLDTLFLMCLFRTGLTHKVRPIAAADHFMTTPLTAWLSRTIGHVVALDRTATASGADVLAEARKALSAGDILLLFPEGTRGDPEQIGQFKAGIARLAQAFPDVPVVPVYLQGTGRVWPRGSKLIVPYQCSAVIGDSFAWNSNGKPSKVAFMKHLKSTIIDLSANAPPQNWL